MADSCILILGGARSGKSRYAQELALKLGGNDVLFVATAEPLDEEMRSRIEVHRRSRPAQWRTLELTRGVGTGIRKNAGNARVVVIDCLTLLVSNLLCRAGSVSGAVTRVRRELELLLHCVDSLTLTFIIVSNEVGLGLVPENRLGRLYRDLLGEVNRAVAERADEVLLMVAGIPLKIKNGKE